MATYLKRHTEYTKAVWRPVPYHYSMW